MADYKDIKGGTIQNFAGDPPAPIAGQVWYDSTNLDFQYLSVNPAGAWASGGNINTARPQIGGTGVQTAAIGFGGTLPPPSTAIVESYNGSSWTEVGDLNTAGRLAQGAGTATAALAIGGLGRLANVEAYDGSSWTETTDINTGRYNHGSDGTANTSALIFGGSTPGATLQAITESWNGSAWTEVGDLNTARDTDGAGPDNTAALAIAGSIGSPNDVAISSKNS